MIKMDYVKRIYSSWVKKEILLDPKLYSDCESREEVMDMIWDDIDEQINYGDVNVKDSDDDFRIPCEFWDEWNKLKLASKSPKSKFDEALDELVKKSKNELYS